MHLSYNTPSSWRIIFRYGGRPRQSSCLKKPRKMVVPGKGCRKEIILQERQLNRSFSYGRPVMLEKLGVYNRRVWTCTQIYKQYVLTDGQKVYLWDQTTGTPSLANPPIGVTPPGTPLLGPVTSYKYLYIKN